MKLLLLYTRLIIYEINNLNDNVVNILQVIKANNAGIIIIIRSFPPINATTTQNVIQIIKLT